MEQALGMDLLCPNQGEGAEKGYMEGSWPHSTIGGAGISGLCANEQMPLANLYNVSIQIYTINGTIKTLSCNPPTKPHSKAQRCIHL